jgi:hypothetical protein
VTTDHFAFVVFVALFCGGLAAVTAAMFWTVLTLVRRHRRPLPPSGPSPDTVGRVPPSDRHAKP